MRIILENISNIINKFIKPIIAIEVLLMIVVIFQLCIKVEKQESIIKKQNKTLEKCSYEIKRLKLVEQNFEEEKEYLYKCYKDIELKAERSGK